MMTEAACRDCSDDTDHCHDTLVVHTDGYIECTADGCVAVLARHVFVVPCGDLGPNCACGEPA